MSSTRFHPRWHRPRMPIFWWLGRLPYTKFIARELTSLPVAYAVCLLLVQVWALSGEEETYRRFEAWLAAPAVLVFHGIVLAGLLFHTATWLNLAPKALVLRLRGRRVPDRAVAAGHYLAWLAASVLVLWYLVGGGA